jgi:beta-galactosidase/beta-glucuronidase
MEMDCAYPRPQLERDDWLCLNGQWNFRFDDTREFKQPKDIQDWPLEILVPFPPESQKSGIGDRGFHKACWYQRDFEMAPGTGRTILHFGAVDYAASVWVNDRMVAFHEGGHTPFWTDITSVLSDTGRQTVSVLAEDDPLDLNKPRGKQDWQIEPHAIWYPRTTGIWQTVWIEQVPAAYIGSIRWTPHLENFALTLEARILGDAVDDLELEATVSHEGKLIARDRYLVVDSEVHRQIILSDPGIDDYRNEILWSPERPTLLQAVIRLLRNGQVVDHIRSYTALRSVNVLRDRFMLNGRPYMLRMVLDQGYWPDTLLAAPDDEALRRDVELAKSMGFNGVRKHQKIECPRYLYWADRLGLLVWGEMPSAYRFTRTAINRTLREWTEALQRDYSHPSVIGWVPFNESWGVPDLTSISEHRHAVQALYHLTKTLDATRPVIGNDGWERAATDIIGIHDYDANTEQLRSRYGGPSELLFDRRRPGGRVLTLDGYPHRGQPIMLTEFGGIGYTKSRAPTRVATWGYSVATDDQQFSEMFNALMAAVIETTLFSGFCYTQFCDTFQEVNGLLCEDRTPKLPIEQIAEAVSASRTWIPQTV